LISASVLDTRRPRRPRASPAEGWAMTFGIAYVKFLSAMLRNSIEKSSMSEANSFVRCVR
jgi:hypothetical protein